MGNEASKREGERGRGREGGRERGKVVPGVEGRVRGCAGLVSNERLAHF